MFGFRFLQYRPATCRTLIGLDLRLGALDPSRLGSRRLADIKNALPTATVGYGTGLLLHTSPSNSPKAFWFGPGDRAELVSNILPRSTAHTGRGWLAYWPSLDPKGHLWSAALTNEHITENSLYFGRESKRGWHCRLHAVLLVQRSNPVGISPQWGVGPETSGKASCTEPRDRL